jgi:hypothetical protein
MTKNKAHDIKRWAQGLSVAPRLVGHLANAFYIADVQILHRSFLSLQKAA